MNRRLVSLVEHEVALTVDGGVTAVLLPAEAADLLVVAARRTPGRHVYLTGSEYGTVHHVELLITDRTSLLYLTDIDEWHSGLAVFRSLCPAELDDLSAQVVDACPERGRQVSW